MPTDRYIQIDDEGFPHFNGVRVTDENVGREIISSVERTETNIFQSFAGGTQAYLEPFDEPYVARQVERTSNEGWRLILPYNVTANFSLDSLSLDDWDRFHGYSTSGIPFVLSRPAQAEFFNLLDDYDDDSIFDRGTRIQIPSWIQTNGDAVASTFWNQLYAAVDSPPWDLNGPHACLAQVLPQLKIPRGRILILGCGAGHDAAYFADQGHMVLGVDISSDGIAQARERYGQRENLEFLEADIFALDIEKYRDSYDIVFEHTCYCAVDPSRRSELTKFWKKALTPGGHLLGVFFAMDHPKGPPFGGSEWEVRERLRKDFEFLYWTRWKQSKGNRFGKEFIVYARVLKD